MKYFMGDVYVGDVGFGFLLSDSRGGDVETTMSDQVAREIVGAANGKVEAPLSTTNLSEISKEEFESFRGADLPSPRLPAGMKVWQVKR
jgi:hypothetical protein